MKKLNIAETYLNALKIVFSMISEKSEKGISETSLVMMINRKNAQERFLDWGNDITPYVIINALQESTSQKIKRFYKEGYSEGFYRIAA